MGRPKGSINAPKFTPAAAPEAPITQDTTLPTLAAVPAPERSGSVEVTDTAVVLTNPTIKLTEWIWLGSEQVNKLTPNRALVCHGVIVIEELNLLLPLTGVSIRTA